MLADPDARARTVALRWRAAIALLLAVIALLALKCAWISDDAYITFRTADNFLRGYGLRWNVDERVQSYTNPLWMFAMIAASAVTRDVYFTSIALGITVTVAACALLAFRVAVNAQAAFVALIVLACSKAFVDFATSGLENPLLHLGLIASFAAFHSNADTGRRAMYMGLAASTVALARLDGLVLIAPLFAVHLAHGHKRASIAGFAAGLAPLLAWELFSLVYYGFLLPNTAYAKLTTGLPARELVFQGARYFADSLSRDPLTLAATVMSLGVAAWRRDRGSLAFAAGIVLHLIYVAKIGGDFMSGRFFTAPLVCAACILARAPFGNIAAAGSALAALALSIAMPLSPLRAPLDYSRGLKAPDHISDSGIADERGYWFGASGLFAPSRQLAAPPYRHVSKGHGLAFTWRDEAAAGGEHVRLANGIGYLGFWCGPKVHLVDPMGLSDALLARQPIISNGLLVEPDKNKFRNRPWRIGHFYRHIPEGYLESLADPTKPLTDPRIGDLRDLLDLITRGDLWSERRWSAIVALNLP